jgi:hypothetical protein
VSLASYDSEARSAWCSAKSGYSPIQIGILCKEDVLMVVDLRNALHQLLGSEISRTRNLARSFWNSVNLKFKRGAVGCMQSVH